MSGCIMYLVILVVAVFVGPILSFFGGYITGSILAWAVGDMLIGGLNLLFDTTRFSTDMIPIVCGALAVIGSFFKSSFNYKEKK